MPRVKRGGYLFIGWVGDHDPRHLHVYKDDVLLARWDLERGQVMSGDLSNRIVDIILELIEEGWF